MNVLDHILVFQTRKNEKKQQQILLKMMINVSSMLKQLCFTEKKLEKALKKSQSTYLL